jgi:transmembrane sensor
MTNPKLLKSLVERYYTNEATPEELEVFVHLQKKGMLDEALNSYLENVIQQETAVPDYQQPQSVFYRSRIFQNIAASAAIILLSGFILFWAMGRVTAISYITVQTDKWQEKNVELSDGSIVRLNRNSELSYPEKWSGSRREVRLLSGEAYFQISKNPKYREFIVHAPDELDINVLGTEFNVTTKNGNTKVFLESGAVKIKRHKKGMLIKPGELADYNQSTGEVSIQDANAEECLAWKNNMFFFDDAPLYEVGAALEAYYHKEVIIEDASLADIRFTGKVSRSNIDLVLKIISRTLNIDIMHGNDQITMGNQDKMYRSAE